MEPLPALFRVPEVILKLLVHPTFSAGVKGDREADRHLRTDTRTPVEDAGQCFPAYAERSRGLRDRQIQGFQAQRPEHLAWVWRIVHPHIHLNCSPHSPRDLRPSRTTERDAPIAAHLYGPRAFPGAAQFMEIQAGQIQIVRAG